MLPAPIDPETRASLLLQLRETPGDQDAWTLFVERYAPMVRRWCAAWGLQIADAEDVTQMVLLKLAANLRKFEYDPSRRFRGFLRTVALHAWSDFLDERRRGAVGSGDTRVLSALESEPARIDLADRIEQEFDLELYQRAECAVRARVEPHTWEAFRLAALDGLSGAEVAARLGMQVGTVFKAKSKVQKMLKDEVERLEGAYNGGA